MVNASYNIIHRANICHQFRNQDSNNIPSSAALTVSSRPPVTDLSDLSKNTKSLQANGRSNIHIQSRRNSAIKDFLQISELSVVNKHTPTSRILTTRLNNRMRALTTLTLVSMVLAAPGANVIARDPSATLQIFPKERQMEVDFCIDRDYHRCTTLRVPGNGDCMRLPPGLDDNTRSIKLPKGGGCKLYKGYNCDDSWDRFRSWRGKSVPDLRDYWRLFGWTKYTAGMELAVSSVRCSLT